METIAEKLAFNVRRLRELRGMSQKQMADLSGVPRPTWANLESGDANPTIQVLTKVAEALRVPIEELLAKRDPVIVFTEDDLVERKAGKVRIRELIPDAPNGLALQRLHFPKSSELTRRPGTVATRDYIACEVGTLELRAEGVLVRLKAGEVASFRSDLAHSLKNVGRTEAVAYSVTTYARLGD